MDRIKAIICLAVALILFVTPVCDVYATEGVTERSTVPMGEAEEKTEEKVNVNVKPYSVSYSELELKLAVAGGLNQYDYTKASWAPLAEALEKGTKLFGKAESQKEVTEAAAEIEKAITGLVRMDYSELEKVLSHLYSIIGENQELHDLWSKIDEAEKKARPLLVSGDQAAVDNAAAELQALLDELYATDTKEPEVEVVVKEVEIEVPPTDDYCNITSHHLWPVLFAVSAVLNIILAAAFGTVFIKKRNTSDNVPLVSYDIDDDM